MQITVKLPDDIVKKMRRAIFSRDVFEMNLGTAVNAGADITSAGLRDYTERVIQAREAVQDVWDEIFPIAAANGYVEATSTGLTMGPSNRTVKFNLPDPEPEAEAAQPEAGA